MSIEELSNTFPNEILRIICEYHHCKQCYDHNLYHCLTCNMCNTDRSKHLFCDICNKCFPHYVKIYMNSTHYSRLNYHEHCNKCNTLMKMNLNNKIYECLLCKKL